MVRISLLALLCLFTNSVQAATSVGPVEFEQLWLLNYQRNLAARYQQHSDLMRKDPRPFYLIGLDSSVNQTIRTSAGDRDATLSRMNLHFQNDDYLFMLDWLSLIPQPQSTEGFTYGDMVLARSWQIDDRLGLTLGGRMQTRPNTTQVVGQTAFNLSDNASHDTVGGFVHLRYGAWNLGSYYSSQDGNQANMLEFTVIDTEARRLSATFSHLTGLAERNIPSRNELGFNLKEDLDGQEMQVGATASSINGSGRTGLGNAFLAYRYAAESGFRYSGGLYHTRIMESDENLRGFKLGLEYVFELQGEASVGIFLRKNAMGDIDAMAIRDENVFSFRLQGRAN
ncbi:MAG: hypothetical protein KKF58_01180 [Gammaproteobacteria bacterium]|nr:hypothetical protein [Gammaproteobacteria bacterium]MBU1446899.1 hypothetical protein [Gammaproteobacteria bacterium]